MMNDSEDIQTGEEVSSSQEPISQFPIFRHKGRLYLSEGAELPPAICVNCGKPSVKAVRKALRSPFNPLTWIGSKPRIKVGLCKQHNESFAMMRALAFSLLGVGLLIFIVGLVNLGVGSILIGGITMLFCGLFRSLKPVWSPNSRVEPMEIRGTGEPFRAIYPEVDSDNA